MLIGVIADLHANLEATQAVLAALDRVAPDEIICLGDVTGYNASPNEVIDLVRERGIPSVMGNHDAAVCGLEEPWLFNSRAETAIEWQTARLREDNKQWLAQTHAQLAFQDRLLAVHGSPSNRDNYVMDWLDAMREWRLLVKADVALCFVGHTHYASFFAERGDAPAGRLLGRYPLAPRNRYLINPGSVGQPRDGDPRAAFGLYDTDADVFEFHRVDYDIQSTVRRIVEAGLPESLASRLGKGK